MKKNDDEKFERDRRNLLDCLFGGIEEIDGLDAQQILQAAGVDYGSVRRMMYDKAAHSAASLRLSGKPVPADLQRALEAFRPPDAPPRNEDEARRQAHGVIADFLGKAEVPASLRFALSYRNRGELTGADVKLLDSMVKKLKEKLGRKE